MKRFFTLSMAVLLAIPLTLGCENKSKTKTESTTTSPGGTTTTTDEHTVKSTGENPPPNAQGETAK